MSGPVSINEMAASIGELGRLYKYLIIHEEKKKYERGYRQDSVAPTTSRWTGTRTRPLVNVGVTGSELRLRRREVAAQIKIRLDGLALWR